MDFLSAVDDTVEYKGIEVKCNLSIEAVFLYFKAMKDDGLTEEEKILTGFDLLVRNRDEYDLSLEDKVKIIGKIIKEKINMGEAKEVDDSPKYFDFDQDNNLIYSSILQQFNINIRDIRVFSQLRWQDFMGLFTNLDSKTPFGQAIYFRQLKITDDMTDEQKDYYREMKKHYALKKDKDHVSFAEMDLPHKIAYLAKQRKEKQKED